MENIRKTDGLSDGICFYGDDTPQKTFSGEPIKVPDWAVKLYLSEDTKDR